MNKRRALSTDEMQDAARLKSIYQEVKKEKGLTQEALGIAMGFESPQSAISQYLNGKLPLNLQVALNFARNLDCCVSDFSPRLAKQLTSGVAEKTAQYATEQNTKVIQLTDATNWQEAQAIQHLPTPPGEFTGFFVIAPDDMMVTQGPTSIAKGAFVAFNTLKTEPVDEKIYLVASEDRPEPIIRKLVKIAGSWELQPANPTYQSERFIEPLRESDQLLGRLAGIANYVE